MGAGVVAVVAGEVKLAQVEEVAHKGPMVRPQPVCPSKQLLS